MEGPSPVHLQRDATRQIKGTRTKYVIFGNKNGGGGCCLAPCIVDQIVPNGPKIEHVQSVGRLHRWI